MSYKEVGGRGRKGLGRNKNCQVWGETRWLGRTQEYVEETGNRRRDDL